MSVKQTFENFPFSLFDSLNIRELGLTNYQTSSSSPLQRQIKAACYISNLAHNIALPHHGVHIIAPAPRSFCKPSITLNDGAATCTIFRPRVGCLCPTHVARRR